MSKRMRERASDRAKLRGLEPARPAGEVEAAENDRRRAADAERILREPLFVEACNALDRELRLMRERVAIRDTDLHTRLILAEQMHAKVLDYLRAVMAGGDAAKLILREHETFMERMKAAATHGLRSVF